MINNIIAWFKNMITKQEVLIQSFPLIKIVAKNKDKKTITYLNDALYPSLTNTQDEIVPKLNMRAVGEAGGGFPLGSLQQQAYGLKLMVNDALVYMISKCPKPIKNWSSVSSLNLMPRAGKDINAFYDRTSLKFYFFRDPVTNRAVYACDSRPVVTHEFGHAFLDILRPDWWSVQSAEVWAYHEAFGDITWAINALQYDALIDHAIAETNGNLLKSSVLTRLASEMGTGIFNISKGKNGELSNCLRDLSIEYKYVIPETLPFDGRDDQLTNECHSFSRVFSGAFWEVLVKIANSQVTPQKSLKTCLRYSRDVMTDLLLKATVSAPTSVRLFEALAKQMIAIDKSQGGKHQTILLQVFNQRNIIKQQVMMLKDVDFESMLKTIDEEHEIQNLGNQKIIRTLQNKSFTLRNKIPSILALDSNPLIDLEIIVPNEKTYYFENDKLIDMNLGTEEEAIDSAYSCLKSLHENNEVGTHENALFEILDGKLLRKQIICKCNKPNYCDPNAPEYNKPWKPANNSGCVACHNKNCKPQSCDCTSPELPKPPKLGCYTKTKVGNSTSYKVGSMASRKVC